MGSSAGVAGCIHVRVLAWHHLRDWDTTSHALAGRVILVRACRSNSTTMLWLRLWLLSVWLLLRGLGLGLGWRRGRRRRRRRRGALAFHELGVVAARMHRREAADGHTKRPPTPTPSATDTDADTQRQRGRRRRHTVGYVQGTAQTRGAWEHLLE